MKIKHFFTALSLLSIGFFSCTNTKSSQDGEDTKTTEVADSSEKEETVIFPSPLQVATIFKKSGLVYIDNVTNPISNVDKYASQMSKSFNFGVYGADLSYCVLNNQTQKAIDYMKNIQKLSNELGIASVFKAETLFSSFEKNIGNEDSLVDILAAIQEKLDDHLQNNETEHMGGVYFAGGWIEAMYMGTKVLESSSSDKLSKHLMEQSALLEIVIKALEGNPNKSDALLQEVIKDLTALNTTIYTFEYIKNRKLDEIPMEEVDLSADEIKKITKQIEDLRNKIINSYK